MFILHLVLLLCLFDKCLSTLQSPIMIFKHVFPHETSKKSVWAIALYHLFGWKGEIPLLLVESEVLYVRIFDFSGPY